MSESNHQKLIHIAKYHPPHKGGRTLLLRQHSPHHYVWYEEDGEQEVTTEVEGPSVEEAMREAHKTWRQHAFRTIICGFRYTLPERDEHGLNALFHQMVASQRSPSGVYFDEELGHNCLVQAASQEALALFKRLESANRL